MLFIFIYLYYSNIFDPNFYTVTNLNNDFTAFFVICVSICVTVTFWAVVLVL